MVCGQHLDSNDCIVNMYFPSIGSKVYGFPELLMIVILLFLVCFMICSLFVCLLVCLLAYMLDMMRLLLQCLCFYVLFLHFHAFVSQHFCFNCMLFSFLDTIIVYMRDIILFLNFYYLFIYLLKLTMGNIYVLCFYVCNVLSSET